MRLKRFSVLFCFLLLTSCNQHNDHQVQGYIEGRYTYLATPVSGVLTELTVKRGDHVKKDQLIFKLEAQPESDAVNAAAENLKQATAAKESIAANLQFAKLTYERYKQLVPRGAIQQSMLDNARSTYLANLAQLNQAEATVASSKATYAQVAWNAEQKEISAPTDAFVFDVFYRIGEYTQATQPVVSLLAPADIKVIFYVREAILGNIKLGDTVSVSCDGCSKNYPAKVAFISPVAEYTPPVIYSTQTSAKLIFRIEAEFAPADAINLHPGQPALVSLNNG